MAASQLELAFHHALDGVEFAFDHVAPSSVAANDDELRVLRVALAFDEARASALSSMHVENNPGVFFETIFGIALHDHRYGSEGPGLTDFSVGAAVVEGDPQRVCPFGGWKSMHQATPCPDLEDALRSPRATIAQARHATTHTVRAFHSSLLERHGFRHVFATRTGGVSKPPYDTLNLGFHLGDDDEAVTENRLRFARSLGVEVDRLFEQRQVHGTAVREVTAMNEAAAIADAEGDALIARGEGLAVAARTADCVPVLVADLHTGAVAAIHAGWRGTVAGIVPKTIQALADDASVLVAAIGPHIRVAAFEIGEEVASEMARAAGARPVVDRAHEKPHGDLSKLVRFQLLDAGLDADAIDDVGGCTYTDAAHFFSHRRERGQTGRHLSAIVASC